MERLRAGMLIFAVLAGLDRAHCEARAEPAVPDPCHTMARAGWPQEVSRFAKPSDTGSYIGYLVGGGSPCRGSYVPSSDGGTWGWDYWGCCFRRNVVLRWWTKPRYQGGAGAYKTDGPRLERGEKPAE